MATMGGDAEIVLATLTAIKTDKVARVVGPDATLARTAADAVLRESAALGYIQFRELVAGELKSEPLDARRATSDSSTDESRVQQWQWSRPFTSTHRPTARANVAH